jgi:4'-phosphopantetheinyl transferase
MILVLYTSFSRQLSEAAWADYLSQMPQKTQMKVSRFFRWQDRQASLFGRLLLQEGLKRLGFRNGVLEQIRENQYGRPYFEGNTDFNISHSGQIVVCSLIEGGRTGIDVEAVREIDFASLGRYMTAEEWRNINRSKDRLREFFRIWTRKESLIKADGRGLSIPLEDIGTISDAVEYGGMRWHLTDLPIDENHPCCLALDREGDDVEIVRKEYA